MAESHVGHIDQIAAALLVRDIGLVLDGEQMGELERHLAKHRTSTLDLAVSRIQARISDAILRLVGEAQAYRSGDWSNGCRSAEAAVLAITSDVLYEIRPREARSKGQILRAMLRQARKRSAADPHYRIVDDSMAGTAGSAGA